MDKVRFFTETACSTTGDAGVGGGADAADRFTTVTTGAGADALRVTRFWLSFAKIRAAIAFCDGTCFACAQTTDSVFRCAPTPI
jgi:hypothetical protein